MLRKLLEFLVGESDQRARPGLSIDVQNYLDNQSRKAIEQIKFQTEARLQEAIREKFRFWESARNYVTIFSIVFAALAFFNAKEYLKKQAEQSARDYLTTNVVHQAMMTAFRSNVTSFVQTELRPLQAQIFDSSNALVSMRAQLEDSFRRAESIHLQAEEALFTATYHAALAGDAIAFDRLHMWSSNLNAHFMAAWRPLPQGVSHTQYNVTLAIPSDALTALSLKAGKAIAEVKFSMWGPFRKPLRSMNEVFTEWDLSLGFDNALTHYHSSYVDNRLSIIERIWNAKQFDLTNRVAFLFDVARKDETIAGRRLACELLNKEFKESFSPLQPEEIARAWETNRLKYISENGVVLTK